jgi:hypothetical protein
LSQGAQLNLQKLNIDYNNKLKDIRSDVEALIVGLNLKKIHNTGTNFYTSDLQVQEIREIGRNPSICDDSQLLKSILKVQVHCVSFYWHL